MASTAKVKDFSLDLTVEHPHGCISLSKIKHGPCSFNNGGAEFFVRVMPADDADPYSSDCAIVGIQVKTKRSDLRFVTAELFGISLEGLNAMRHALDCIIAKISETTTTCGSDIAAASMK